MLFGSVFLTIALGCAVISFAAGTFGAIVSLRARNLDADVLAHCTLPGLVLGLIFSQLLGFTEAPGSQILVIVCGVGAAGLASLALSYFSTQVTIKWALGNDIIQAVLLGLGFGLGLILLSLVQGYFPAQRSGLDRLLIGNAALLTSADVWIGCALSASLIMVGWLARRPIIAFLFDPQAWQVAGGRQWLVETLYAAGLFVVTIICIRLVGAVLAVALLTMPYLIAKPWASRGFAVLALTSGLAAAAGAVSGSWVSALSLGPEAQGLPTGPCIILALFIWLLVSHILFKVQQHLRYG